MCFLFSSYCPPYLQIEGEEEEERICCDRRSFSFAVIIKDKYSTPSPVSPRIEVGRVWVNQVKSVFLGRPSPYLKTIDADSGR
jgi:hypothetical protein